MAGIEIDDMLRSSGNIAKILKDHRDTNLKTDMDAAIRKSTDGDNSDLKQSIESTISAKDFLGKHKNNINRLAQVLGLE